jgi:hypothetical protein
MNLRTFAATHRLHTNRDVDGTDIIAGKHGHIYEHSDTQLGLLFMPPAARARLWSATKAKATTAGIIVRQNADSEGTLLFDCHNPVQARLAVSLVRVRPRRVLTDEQRLALSERLSKARQSIQRKGTLASETHERQAA